MFFIDYGEKLVLDEFLFNDELQKIILTKKATNARDNFILYSYSYDNMYNPSLQGYMYFSINLDNNSSSYIGTYVNPKYRNSGVAQMLNATWIKFCLDNGIEYLKTNIRQRKPFSIYLLKKYNFEIKDLDDYIDRSIYICKRNQDDAKCLVFDSERQKKIFKASNIYKDDNYVVLDNTENVLVLDKVILNHTYYLDEKDNENAYQKALKIRDRKEDI